MLCLGKLYYITFLISFQLNDAYEEVDEQRQVVAQWKRKTQKLQGEMHDQKLLLEEQVCVTCSWRRGQFASRAVGITCFWHRMLLASHALGVT